MFISVFVAASVVVPNEGRSANPIAKAESGELQCYRPDVQNRTCESIASYERTGPGTYDNRAVIALGNGATLETHSPVVIRGDSVCGFIRSQDLTAGTLRVGGKVMPAEAAKPVLERMVHAMASLADKEICTRYERSGAAFTAKISIAGTYQPDKDEAVKWIDPADGYTVTP